MSRAYCRVTLISYIASYHLRPALRYSITLISLYIDIRMSTGMHGEKLLYNGNSWMCAIIMFCDIIFMFISFCGTWTTVVIFLVIFFLIQLIFMYIYVRCILEILTVIDNSTGRELLRIVNYDGRMLVWFPLRHCLF